MKDEFWKERINDACRGKLVEPSSPADCWAIYDEHGNPLRSGISFNSENEAWRCYFCNRSGWERLREFSRQHGYKCIRAVLTPNASGEGRDAAERRPQPPG